MCNCNTLFGTLKVLNYDVRPGNVKRDDHFSSNKKCQSFNCINNIYFVL